MAALHASSKYTAHPPEYFGGLRFFVGLRFIRHYCGGLALEPNLGLLNHFWINITSRSTK
jgi:hypothetical protein